MKYYFVGINNETFITEYETLEELEEQEAYYISEYDEWYIIKGDKIKYERNKKPVKYIKSKKIQKAK